MNDNISHTAMLPESSHEGLLTHTCLRSLEAHAEVASTNTVALHRCELHDLQTPMLIQADRQTDGRGRGNNRWWSAGGALTFSLILDADTWQLPAARWPQLSLATGLAVARAMEDCLAPGDNVQVKWPNDVLIDGRKVCGILIEVPPRQPGRFVVGIGINLQNSLADAPQELRERAVSLCDLLAEPPSARALLSSLLRHLDQELTTLASESDLPARWQKKCALTGHAVSLDTPAGSQRGLCMGIDEHGALLLQTATGVQAVVSGVAVRTQETPANERRSSATFPNLPPLPPPEN